MGSSPLSSASFALPGPDVTLSRSTSKDTDQDHGALLAKAKEFESILLGQWLGSAETSFGSLPGSDESRDAGDDQFTSFAVQQLARKMTDVGGVGISAIVAQALEKGASGKRTADAAPPRSEH